MTKRGPLSESEKKIISETYILLSVNEIAEKLNRPISIVKRFIETNLGQRTADGISLPGDTRDIENRAYWAELRTQFNTAELRLFAFHWKEVRNQFRDDILYTEELQIVELCRLELLTNRVLTEQQKIIEEIGLLETESSSAELGEARMLRQRIDILRIAQKGYIDEYRQLYDKKTKTLEQLKATRKERIKQIQDQKQTIQGWMSAISTDQGLRDSLSQYAEKHRMATEMEYRRLSEYFVYADSQNDQPLLTPETIKDDNTCRD